MRGDGLNPWLINLLSQYYSIWSSCVHPYPDLTRDVKYILCKMSITYLILYITQKAL